MPISEIIPELVDAALVIEPALVDVPVLGKLLIFLQQGSGGETKALEKLEEIAKKKQTERKTRKQRNERYVLKASDAMDCVEKHLMSGGLLLSLGRGIVNALSGSGAGSAPDLLLDQIWTCIEEKVLRQDTPRVLVEVSGKEYHRPAKGHGHGRKKVAH